MREFKIGNKYFIFEKMEDRIVEVILYKINRNEKSEIESYSLASQIEDAGYTCNVGDEEYLFDTFDDCLKAALDFYKETVLKNSEAAKQKVEEENEN